MKSLSRILPATGGCHGERCVYGLQLAFQTCLEYASLRCCYRQGQIAVERLERADALLGSRSVDLLQLLEWLSVRWLLRHAGFVCVDCGTSCLEIFLHRTRRSMCQLPHFSYGLSSVFHGSWCGGSRPIFWIRTLHHMCCIRRLIVVGYLHASWRCVESKTSRSKN